MNGIRITRAMVPWGIFLFGVGISLWYGRQGLNPLDSCIVFDGAWRRMCGQAFFEDFSSPNGFVPIAIQTVFFRVFGVNWFAYCLHAAVFNGLFAVLIYGVLRLAGGPRWLAAGYGTLSAVVFYPPMGVPYMDQHSFFFILLAVWMGMKASTMNDRWRFWMWVALPVIGLLAILSKQSPGFFAIPVLIVVLVGWVPRRDGLRLGAALLLGIVPAVLAFWLVVGWPWAIGASFWENFWVRPQTLADERFAAWTHGPFKALRTMAWYPFQALSHHNFVHRHLLYLPVVLLPAEWLLRRWKGKPREVWPRMRLLMLGISMTVACSFFMSFTLNQPENGLPLVFAAIGLGHIFFREWLKGFGFAQRFKHFPKLLFGGSLLLLGYAGLGTFDFHQRTNVPRLVLDFTPSYPFEPGTRGKGQVGFLEYQAPFHYQQLKPWELAVWLREHEGNFFLFGDLTLLYGLTGKPSVSPFLWIHEGLTLPKVGTEDFEETDLQLLEHIQAHQVRFIVFEHPQHVSWMHSRWESFPHTATALSARKIREYHVGGFPIWQLQ